MQTLLWPQGRLGEAVYHLATAAGIAIQVNNANTLTNPDPRLDLMDDRHKLDQWLGWAADQLRVEVEPVKASGDHYERFMRAAAPAVFQSRVGGHRGFVLLLKAKKRFAVLLTPQGKHTRVKWPVLEALLWADLKEPARRWLRSLVERTNIPQHSQNRAVAAMLKQRVATQYLDGCWLLRQPPSRKFSAQLRHHGLFLRAVRMVIVFAVIYLLELAAWGLMGWGVLSGRMDHAWLLAWALVLLTMVPLNLWGGWLQAAIAINVSTLLKKRLLAGALAMDMDAVRRQGVGRLLGRVIDSQAIDALALNGGFAVMVAVLELLFASAVLGMGAAGLWHVLLLWFFLLVVLLLGRRYYQRLRLWTRSRLKLTHDLVERMAGHRTRLVQEPPSTLHQEEDGRLQVFARLSRDFDRSFVPLAAGAPRGWLIAGLAGLAAHFIFGHADTVALAIGLGGVLLAYRAFTSLVFGLSALSRAAVSWFQVKEIFMAGAQRENSGVLQPFARAAASKPARMLLQVGDVSFGYRRGYAPVLQRFDLSVNRGERILLEGPSGCGKSTLAALLVGLRQPDQGLLLLEGLDSATWGSQWRRVATSAPQFHENHILCGTLAFNLLMGRRWPPGEGDLESARQLCVELGLGGLLQRMPGGLMQVVGETGWQLSHGERSRIYLARALLQQSELVVLDESFAALDPQTLFRCLRTAMARAPALIVIAHR